MRKIVVASASQVRRARIEPYLREAARLASLTKQERVRLGFEGGL